MASYKARKDNYNYSDEPGQTQSFASATKGEKEAEKDSTKKLTKTAAKGAGAYFGGAAGAKAVDMAASTPVGDKIINKGSDLLGKVPGINQAAKKLDDSGAIDAADKGLDLASGSGALGKEAGNSGNVANGPKSSEAKNDTKKGGSSSNDKGDSSSSDKKNNKNNQGNEKENDEKHKVQASFDTKKALFIIIPVVSFIVLLLIIVAIITAIVSEFEDALGISSVTGGDTGPVEYTRNDKTSTEYYQRVYGVQKKLAEEGKTVDSLKVVAVFHAIQSNKFVFSYSTISENDIEDVANAMFEEKKGEDGSKYYVYNEEKFRERLVNNILPKYLPMESKSGREKVVDKAFDYIDRYYKFIDKDSSSSCSDVGACTYNIKGFAISGKGNLTKPLNLSNIKVRLMQTGFNYGGTFGLPMPNEELVDFEKYVLGVALQEIGPDAPDEAIKAQFVAARSYILARGFDMGGWRGLKQEGNQIILQTCNSTQDQVYCDPDKGCSADIDGQNGQIYSGLSHRKTLKKPLSADHKMRSLASETAGELLVNSQGYVVYTTYTNTQQEEFKRLARQGLNYKQILLQVYNSSSKPYGAADIEKHSCNNTGASCSNQNQVTGEFTTWKQFNGPWINVRMGNGSATIKKVGCLATSISIQVARSGVPTNVQGELNPGTFVECMNRNGLFGSGGGLLNSDVSACAPNFIFVGDVSVNGYSQSQKLNVLNNLLSQGYYVIAEVKQGNGGSGQHWVAISGTNGNEITMMDPGSSATSMWQRYSWPRTSRYKYYKANK